MLNIDTIARMVYYKDLFEKKIRAERKGEATERKGKEARIANTTITVMGLRIARCYNNRKCKTTLPPPLAVCRCRRVSL